MYIELVEKSVKNRNTVISIEELSTAPRAFEAYCSHFPYDKTIVDYLKLNNSVKGFTGVQYCRAIVIDIDNLSLITAHESAKKLISRLVTEYGVEANQIDIAFSGSKGFHVILSEQLLGGITPAPKINENVKTFVEILTAGIPDIDFSIYDSTRIVRMKNSINQKSGLYKIPITLDDFLQGVDHVKELATKPKQIAREKRKPARKLVELWVSTREPKSEIYKLESEADGFFAPPQQGERNNKLFKQACMLFDYSTLSEKHAIEIITSINNASPKPLPNDEVRSIVVSAKNRTNNDVETIQAFTMDELLPEWSQYMTPDANPFTLLDDDFDSSIRNKMRGKMIPILGYPGTKKSLFALNIVYQNMVKYGARVLYSNMEMGAPELISRAIDIRFHGDSGLATYRMEKMISENYEQAMELYKNLVSDFGNKLYICQNSQMVTSNYEMLIRDIESKAGKVDFLVVDGLSMMGGAGTDMERVNKHTAELKALANKTGLCILPIVHLSKGLTKHTRSMLSKARDSQKIEDNGDYFIQLSMCADNMSSDEDVNYIDDLIYARFWAKRASGREVSKIFEFEKDTLQIKSTNYEPKNYDPKRKSKTDFI